MQTILEYKCPACGGALSFDSSLQKMKCPYCDTEFEVEALRELDEALKQEGSSDFTWESQPDSLWSEEETQNLRSYICQSCGGEIIGDENTAATACPYCGNPVVLSHNVSGQLKPDCIIPFKLDKKAAMAAFEADFKNAPFLPDEFKSKKKIEEMKNHFLNNVRNLNKKNQNKKKL